MARFLHSIVSSVCRKYSYILLACAWILGLGFGGYLFRYDSSIASLMGAAVTGCFSIAGFLLSLLLPFLFSVFAVYIFCPWLLHFICFAKAASFGLVSCALFGAFPGSGWLVRHLLLFADQMGVLLLLIFWQRHISGFRRLNPAGCAMYFAAVLVAVGLDHYFIAPFLRSIMTI